MKPTKEQVEAYKSMAKESSGADMKAQIQENLSRTCDKFPGNEDKLDRCLEYLNDCAREILGNKNGDVPDEVCYRICRDYFNDEIWKKEDEEESKKKAEREKLEAKRKVKVKKKIEALKNEPDKKFEKCSKCKKDFLHLWKDGLCMKCFEKKEKADAAAAEKARKKAEAEEAWKKEAEKSVPDQIDMFAMLGV